MASAPLLAVAAASGDEDTAIALTISAVLTDPAETLSITLSTVPAGAILSAGTNLVNGVWFLTPAQLTGLTLTPPANASGVFQLNVTAVSTDGSFSAMTNATLTVDVAGIVDAPLVITAPASGMEDTAIPLDIHAALTDNDGSETLSIRISGVPDGALLSAGTDTGGGIWMLTPAQLSGLTITPPLYSDADFNLVVTAIAMENGQVATTSQIIPVTVTGVATMPFLSVQNAAGNEDTAIELQINAALVDIDGSETLAIRIDNVPDGATLSAGVNNGNGSWLLTPEQLAGLTITPPANFKGTIPLTIKAIATEQQGGDTAIVSQPYVVTVLPALDALTVSVDAASVSEDAPISLSIDVHTSPTRPRV